MLYIVHADDYIDLHSLPHVDEWEKRHAMIV